MVDVKTIGPELRAKRLANRTAAKKYRAKKKAQLKKIQEGAQDLAEKALENAPRAREATLLATFIGLTVGYKEGVFRFLEQAFDLGGQIKEQLDEIGGETLSILVKLTSPLLGFSWNPEEKAPKSVEKQFREAFEAIRRDREDIALSVKVTNEKFRNNEISLEEFKLIMLTLNETLMAIRSNEIAFQKMFAQYEMKMWLIAMGLAGGTIYFLQENTVTELTELIPGQ